MDMMFRDDECRVRTENAPANFTTIKHVALNLIGLKSRARKTLRVRRKIAGRDDDYLASLVGGVILLYPIPLSPASVRLPGLRHRTGGRPASPRGHSRAARSQCPSEAAAS